MFGERRGKRACLARGGGRGHVWREEGKEGMFGERRGKRACLACSPIYRAHFLFCSNVHVH